MGQPLKAIPGGVHRFQGQTKGQNFNPGRRGVGRNKFEGVGPTDELRKSLGSEGSKPVHSVI